MSLCAACASPPFAVAPPPSPTATSSNRGFTLAGIPDQEPAKLQQRYSKLAKYLEKELKMPVVYKPITEHEAAVTEFQNGDLDLVWYNGLLGVQARSQVTKAEAIAQRNVDTATRSIFIVNKKIGIGAIGTQKELSVLKGRTFTFGGETSTPGRLMPQFFLEQAGMTLKDFKGKVSVAKSQDAALEAVQAGTYDAGVLSEQVWLTRLQEGKADADKVNFIWRSPVYADSHWVLHPKTSERYGKDFKAKVVAALLKLDAKDPEQREILSLFGAKKFVPTENARYSQIEAIGRKIGKLK